jgi:TfoX/Sxy family transcriptional regulator of competence genes
MTLGPMANAARRRFGHTVALAVRARGGDTAADREGGGAVKVEKPGPQILELFESHVPDRPGIERRAMFGARAAWIDGKMFMGTFEQDLVLRLAPEDRAELIAAGGEAFAPMGRTMREYVVVPRELHDRDGDLAAWVERSLRFVSALPPKAKKPRRAAEA